jgi:hypothetical protein
LLLENILRRSTYAALTDNNSHFIFPNVAPGRYRLRACDSGANRDDNDDSSDPADVTRIDVAEKESKSVKLKLPGKQE